MTETMIYGATGYTGRLIAERAVADGSRPILAGRDEAAVRSAADELGLDWRAFALDRPEDVVAGLDGVAAVLNAAGPFSATAGAMVDACFATGTHYCDITGEIDVFEALAGRGADAEEAGIALLPGAGFDVVPSDCLLAHVTERSGGAVRLRVSIGGDARVSRGTAKTMIEMAHRGTAVRRDGRIVWEADTPHCEADFGEGTEPTMGVSYGDVSTAWHSTGSPDVSAFMRVPALMTRAAGFLGHARGVLGSATVQALLKGIVDMALPAGPSPDHRARARMTLVAEAWNAAEERFASTLRTPEPYRLTALTAAETLRRMATGEAGIGYQTPSTAFGADFPLGFDDVVRTDS